MRITIDTKEDSKEEIRHIIDMLCNVVGMEKAASSRNIFEDSAPSVSDNASSVFNLFDSPKTNNTNDVVPVLKTVEKEEVQEEIPEVQIIEY